MGALDDSAMERLRSINKKAPPPGLERKRRRSRV